jgi:hypothetical protein
MAEFHTEYYTAPMTELDIHLLNILESSMAEFHTEYYTAPMTELDHPTQTTKMD